MGKPIITRFAPSPTGELHLGHIYAAKIAHHLAHTSHGHFLLRLEDIDPSRVRPEFSEKILQDLTWLSLHWHGEILLQSTRHPAYASALGHLRTRHLTYPCFCTRRDIQTTLTAPHGPPSATYPGTCRSLPPTTAAARIATGQPHSWRLNSAAAATHHGPLTFHDLRLGTSPVDPSLNGDAILARSDIGIAYHLAVVIDDAFQNISHVTRGEDLHTATHIHRQLQALLHLPQPTYLHHPCLLDETGKRLAKRDHAHSIRSLRENGFTPAQVLALAIP